MRYMMRQRILSWGDDFSIKDADGQEVYYIDGKVFSFGDKLSIKDRSGAELVRINQKLLSLGPQYEIVSGGETVAVVKKHLFTPFRARFTVDVPGPDYRAVRNTRIRSSSASSAAANPRSRGRRDCT